MTSFGSMAGIMAWIMAMMILAFGPSPREFERLTDRVSSIESRKCTLMAVTTPTGTATICALQ